MSKDRSHNKTGSGAQAEFQGHRQRTIHDCTEPEQWRARPAFDAPFEEILAFVKHAEACPYHATFLKKDDILADVLQEVNPEKFREASTEEATDISVSAKRRFDKRAREFLTLPLHTLGSYIRLHRWQLGLVALVLVSITAGIIAIRSTTQGLPKAQQAYWDWVRQVNQGDETTVSSGIALLAEHPDVRLLYLRLARLCLEAEAVATCQGALEKIHPSTSLPEVPGNAY